MKDLRSVLLILAPLALLSNAVSADTVIVNQQSHIFTPADVTISVGDTVRWIHTSGHHDVTEGTDGTIDGDEAFFSLLDTSVPTFEVTFDAAFVAANPRPGGVYDYFCTPHFVVGMVGTVTVLEAPGSPYCDCSGGGATCAIPAGAGEGCMNSGGTGATLVASGTAIFSNDTFLLDISGVPGNKPGLVLRGNNQIAAPAGDGILCTAGGSLRSHVQVTVAGTTSYTHFNGATFGSNANAGGAPTNYQFWYRDSQNNCSGTGFNFSNAWTVTWLP